MISYGSRDGRYVSLQDFRREIVAPHLPGLTSCLEIGPFMRPTLSGEEVQLRTLDYYTTEQLRTQAEKLGRNPDLVIPVDYVVAGEQYDAVVLEKFSIIIACHVLEHIVEFVKFFQTMGNMLEENGMLLIVLPDKRYSFDRLRPNSSFAQIVYEYLDPDVERQKKLYSIETEVYYDFAVTGRKNDVGKRLHPDNLKTSLARWHPGCHCHVFEFEDAVRRIFLPLCGTGFIDFTLVTATLSRQLGEFALLFRKGRSGNAWAACDDFYELDETIARS